jgi:hypothetical protein
VSQYQHEAKRFEQTFYFVISIGASFFVRVRLLERDLCKHSDHAVACVGAPGTTLNKAFNILPFVHLGFS